MLWQLTYDAGATSLILYRSPSESQPQHLKREYVCHDSHAHTCACVYIYDIYIYIHVEICSSFFGECVYHCCQG